MTEETKIRFAIDTNVLGYLAMASLCSKEKFFYYNKFSETTYKNLLWLNKMVNLGKIELVVPLTVFDATLNPRFWNALTVLAMEIIPLRTAIIDSCDAVTLLISIGSAS